MGRRTAFSLVEVILVLALLVVVTAIVLPMTETMFRDAKVRSAADGFRAALVKARTHAMEEGRAYRVGIILGDGAYRIAPDLDSYWTGSGQGGSGPQAVEPLREANYLPHEILFSVGPASPVAPSAPAQKGARPPADSIDAGRYVAWVVFFSDGTAESDQEIVFQAGNSGPAVVVTLRAMTGVTTLRTQQSQGASRP